MKKKLIVILAALVVLAFGSVPIKAQYISYDQTIGYIRSFDKAKFYSPAATGDLMDCIMYGMTRYSGSYMSEGLKYRLISVSSGELNKEIYGVNDIADAGVMILMFESRRNVTPRITDRKLKSLVGRDGSTIKRSIQKIWSSSEINSVANCLEAYDPWTAAALANMICKPIYSSPENTYEYTRTTWASQSLWDIYNDITIVEFAKRSVVLKLLEVHGYFHIPDATCATFRYSGWPNINITLDPIGWNESDIPELARLLSNNYYKVWALAQLRAMHVPGY